MQVSAPRGWIKGCITQDFPAVIRNARLHFVGPSLVPFEFSVFSAVKQEQKLRKEGNLWNVVSFFSQATAAISHHSQRKRRVSVMPSCWTSCPQSPRDICLPF